MSIVDEMKKKADKIVNDKNTQVGIDRYGRPINRFGDIIVKHPYKDRYGRIVKEETRRRSKITPGDILKAIFSRKKDNEKERE